MKKTITLKIDVTEIDKSRLFEGKKGTYLDAVLFYDDEKDQYGNNGMIVQSVSKEERENGTRGNILGNAKTFDKQEKPNSSNPVDSSVDMSDSNIGIDGDLPFSWVIMLITAGSYASFLT